MKDNFETPAMTERDVARALNVSVGSLRTWRRSGDGPPFVKISRLVRYRASDLARFLESCASTTGGKGGRINGKTS